MNSELREFRDTDEMALLCRYPPFRVKSFQFNCSVDRFVNVKYNDAIRNSVL